MAEFEPDILTEGLDVVFCGLNYAASAVKDGYHFSHRNNRFWPVLHLAGFTDCRLQPADQRRLLDYGCGLTAVVRRPTVSASEVSPAEFRSAQPEFESKMRCYAPRVIASSASGHWRACSAPPTWPGGRIRLASPERGRGCCPIRVG